ncbi:FkbM family methyltransferase, partial [Candidatus Sumerlaeota bacterium]
RSFFDIGANTGVFSLLACAVNPTVKVTAFEPAPGTFEFLDRNVELNGWGDRCQLEKKAVSDSIGSAPFHVPNTISASGNSSLDPAGYHGIPGDVITVPVTTVDAVAEKLGRPDLVKIDVEGFEDKVLQGMAGALGSAQVALIVECNPDGPCAEVERILTEFNYSFFHLRASGAAPMAHIVPDESGKNPNYLCLPQQLADWRDWPAESV